MHLEITAHARLHFGFLDLASGERRYGGFGVAIDRPRLVLRMEPAAKLRVEGKGAERIARMVSHVSDAMDLPAGARIEVVEAIPGHVGLGSGTQLSLAVAAGLARLHGRRARLDRLVVLMGRARRSGIGFHTFAQGGFVVEGGHPGTAAAGEEGPPPLLVRQEFPDSWRIILCLPRPRRTMSGPEEDEAFRRMTPAPEASAGRLSRIVLTRLLPALAERRLEPFGAALAEAQEIVGSWFAPFQGGMFHPDAAPLALALRRAGAIGVGQSSWGPAVYALASGGVEKERLVAAAREASPTATILPVSGFNRGASFEAR